MWATGSGGKGRARAPGCAAAENEVNSAMNTTLVSKLLQVFADVMHDFAGQTALTESQYGRQTAAPWRVTIEAHTADPNEAHAMKFETRHATLNPFTLLCDSARARVSPSAFAEAPGATEAEPQSTPSKRLTHSGALSLSRSPRAVLS